jgi:hypothetical protein
VYQKAYALSLNIYHCTKTFPKEELFGIVSKSVGVPYRYRVIFQKDTAETIEKKLAVSEHSDRIMRRDGDAAIPSKDLAYLSRKDLKLL